MSEFIINNRDTLIKYTGNDDVVEIPESVIFIGEKAFDENCTVKEIYIPDTVQRIFSQAFFDCKSLEKIKLPSRLCSIGPQAFAGCISLKEIIIPEEFKAEVDASAFIDCPLLPEKITNIFGIEYRLWTVCAEKEAEIVANENTAPIFLKTIRYTKEEADEMWIQVREWEVENYAYWCYEYGHASVETGSSSQYLKIPLDVAIIKDRKIVGVVKQFIVDDYRSKEGIKKIINAVFFENWSGKKIKIGKSAYSDCNNYDHDSDTTYTFYLTQK